MGGTYKLSSSIKINNTNTFDKEVVYKAYKNQEVTFTTAEEISLSLAQNVTDSTVLDRLSDQSARDKIYVIDMSDYSNKIPAQALPGTYSTYISNSAAILMIKNQN